MYRIRGAECGKGCRGHRYASVCLSEAVACGAIPVDLVVFNPCIVAERTVFAIVVRVNQVNGRCRGAVVCRSCYGNHTIARPRNIGIVAREIVGLSEKIIKNLPVVYVGLVRRGYQNIWHMEHRCFRETRKAASTEKLRREYSICNRR